ncbi:universal stress protein [Agromyces lapidis]|uniref:Universal stress protein n=1 Tax=Agromyces lapidis TaxID=279574 RepID=A0ABV5STW2_9MICO|nr:universal stress protein [Agromyces lapidis]
MATGILVGIDGSIASRAAVVWAIEAARATDAEVSLLLVVDDEWGTVGGSAVAELQSEAAALTARELEYAREHAGEVRVSAEYTVGSPMLVLATEAAEYSTIAIGTHKVGSFHGLALGTRAIQLAATSPVPLAVVPVASGGHRSGVVVGISGAPGEASVIRAAIAEARRRNQPLVLIRANATSAAISAEAVDWAVRLAEGLGVPSGITVRRASGSAGEALASMSGRATLTIAGRPTQAGARGFRPLGRTVGDLVMNLGGPILIVPFLLDSSRAAASDPAQGK